MAVYSVGGSKLFIGGVKAISSSSNVAFAAADFDGETWVEIGQLVTIGSLGDSSTLVDVSIISQRRTLKIKGTQDAGSMEITAVADYADAGQLALRAAAKSDENYAFKLEFADKPATGASPKNSVRYFAALVMSAVDKVEETNSVLELVSTLELNSNIVVVHASAT